MKRILLVAALLILITGYFVVTNRNPSAQDEVERTRQPNIPTLDKSISTLTATPTIILTATHTPEILMPPTETMMPDGYVQIS